MISTLLLTILLMIGLFFFLRGSIKDRTEIVRLVCPENEDNILSYLREYFLKRAYQVKEIDPENNKVTLEGLVSPSIFLAVLLSFLASCGLFCFALVLSMVFSTDSKYFLIVIVLAPLVGYFYWQGAERIEKVVFKLDQQEEEKTLISIQAHRDELIQLQLEFPFNYVVQE